MTPGARSSASPCRIRPRRTPCPRSHASPIPVVADIHFDYRLALAAAKAGVHKIRINPGNIGEPDNVRKVAEACRERGIPIRIGVNGGSLESACSKSTPPGTPEALVESAQGGH